MDASAIVHIIICLLVSLIGISVNLILMTAIAKSRSASFRSYSIILFFQAAFETVASLASAFAIVRVVKAGEDLIAVFYGPCVFTSAIACTIAQRFEVKMAGTINTWFILTFVYRYYVIAYNPLSVRLVSVISIGMSLWTLTAFAEKINKSPANITDTMTIYRPEISLHGVELYAWSSYVLSLGFFVFFALWFGSIIFMVQGVRWKILKFLRSSSSLRESTKSLQRDFINALTAQGLLILLSLWSLCSFWFIPFYDIKNYFFEASSFMAHTLQFAISPLTTLYFVRPYRRFVKSKLLRINDVREASTSSTNSSID